MEISFAFSLTSTCEGAISSAITVDDSGIEPVPPQCQCDALAQNSMSCGLKAVHLDNLIT